MPNEEKEVIMDFLPNGKIVTDFKGYEGNCCFDDAAKVDEALKEYGVDMNFKNPENIKCHLPVSPLQPRKVDQKDTIKQSN